MGIGWAHGAGNLFVLVLTFMNFWFRQGNPELPILPQGLIISTIIVILLMITGWLGGEMVFRHGVGVAPTVGRGDEMKDPDFTPGGKPDIGKA